MNPSSPSGIWCNPPPPGTEFPAVEELTDCCSKMDGTGRVIDQIDPFLKNPEYIKYEKQHVSSSTSERKHRPHDNRHSRRRRSRSRSRDRHRHRRRHKSTSRSRSRSYSRGRRRHDNSRERRRTTRYSRSRSPRSRSRSRSHRTVHRTRPERSHRSHSGRKSHSPIFKSELIDEKMMRHRQHQEDEELDNDDDDDDDDDDDEPVNENAFKNDGTFMEMFKKMQEEQQMKEAHEKAGTSEEKNRLPVFGKRRGGKVLKTGVVQKNKTFSQDDLENAQDAWTLYMKEVKRYKEACCDDDSKTRLLVK